MRIIFYHDERSLNDATLYYIKIIQKAAFTMGIPMVYNTSLEGVLKNDIIFTITGKYFFKAKIKYPFLKTMFWAQGVGPEEYFMTEKNVIKYKLKKIVEYLSVKTSNLLFMVSDTMYKHYIKKYHYNKSNYIIMPCYNINYRSGITKLSNERYSKPSFVYAGTLSSWQCIDKTLEVFQKFQSISLDATLTLLVKEKEKALALIKKYNLKNVEIKYVELSKLQDELTNYKFGFIIREHNTVNNVATPTKMNSYLASGIIPIFTDAVDSFVKNIDLGKNYTLCLSSNNTSEEMSKTLLDFEKKNINTEELDNHIQRVFDNYYNDKLYIDKIKIMLNKCFN